MRRQLLATVLESLWRTSKDGVVVADRDGEIVLVSPSVLEMLNYSEDDLVGKPVEVLVPEERWAIHRKHRAAYMQNPHPRKMGKTALLMAVSSDGHEIPADISLANIEHEGEVYIVAVIRDASARHAYEQSLREASFRDGLTDLYNRAFLDEELKRLERGRRRPISILVADLDRLKAVNDERGHAEGDKLLKRTAQALHSVLRVDDIVSRTGGDEFVAVLPGATKDVAEKILERVRTACENPDSGEPIELSIGVAVGQPGDLLRDTLREADAAMYRDKRRRR